MPAPWQDDLDEVRLSGAARSADWIAASYGNMSGGLVVYEGIERL